MENRGRQLGLSSHQTQWTVFHAASIPQEPPNGTIELPYRSSKGARRPTAVDYRYAIHLCSLIDRDRVVKIVESGPNGTPPDPMPAVDAKKKKAALIKDVDEARFYNITAQVVKTYDSSGDKYELEVTDYTTNRLLFNHELPDEESSSVGRDGDEFAYLPRSRRKQRAKWQWPGPFGKMTLHVTLFEPHASYAQSHVKEGDFVLLRNLHIRMGRGNVQVLEGVLHTDRRYEDLIQIEVLEDRTDDRVKDVLKRKLEYTKKHKKRLRGTLNTSTTPQKRPRSKERRETEREAKLEANSKKKGTAKVETARPEAKKDEFKKNGGAKKHKTTEEEVPASIKVMRGSELTKYGMVLALVVVLFNGIDFLQSDVFTQLCDLCQLLRYLTVMGAKRPLPRAWHILFPSTISVVVRGFASLISTRRIWPILPFPVGCRSTMSYPMLGTTATTATARQGKDLLPSLRTMPPRLDGNGDSVCC